MPRWVRAADEDAAQRASGPEPEGQGIRRDPVSLRQRLWPVVEMLRQAHAAHEPIVWGV